MGKKTVILAGLIFAFLMILSPGILSADEPSNSKGVTCAVYISGNGCSNCAKADPILFSEVVTKNPHLIILEYEVYKKKSNKDVKDEYFNSYLPGGRSGVPFLIYSKEKTAMGATHVITEAWNSASISSNACPLSDGTALDFENLDLTSLAGDVVIWTKNRVLIKGKGGDNEVLRKILLAEDVSEVLDDVSYKKVSPQPVPISLAELNYQHAVKIGNWLLQWNGDPVKITKNQQASMQGYLVGILFVIIFLAILISSLNIKRKTGKGMALKFELKSRLRDIVITLVSFLALVVIFFLAKNISSDFLEASGYSMPLPLFTFLIALVDGFNPCNMFVLTCLLALMISTSESRFRLYVVAFSFVGMVYIFYFMFMAAWLNAFKYISFVTPLRIGLAVMAIIVGIINCKELLFFKKGISLTIPESQKGFLMKRMESVKEAIKTGSMPLLVTSSIGLAVLSSLVEIPCTAGFPIIYTGILSGKGFENNLGYYAYLALYNLVYVLPLIVIVCIFLYTFRARQITQRQMEIIKFVGGVIMILLGILLLANPGLLGLGIS